MQFVIFFRGINVGGKNKVSMSSLKEYYAAAGFHHVRSYINSGNLLVSHNELSAEKIRFSSQEILAKHFDFPIETVVFSEKEYQEFLLQTPEWWGEDESCRHNALFLLPHAPIEEAKKLEKLSGTYDQIYFQGKVIFWSSAFETDYSKTRYSKIMDSPLYKAVTIRNRNTFLKIGELLKEQKKENTI